MFLLATSVVLGACGGSDSTNPSEPFPNVAGFYDVDGGFDGLTRSEGSIAGSLTLTQTSLRTGTLGGTMTLTLNSSGDVTTVSNAAILSSSVTQAGEISFRLGSTEAGAGWTFSGTRGGKVITGRHTLASSGETFSSDWTGTSP